MLWSPPTPELLSSPILAGCIAIRLDTEPCSWMNLRHLTICPLKLHEGGRSFHYHINVYHHSRSDWAATPSQTWWWALLTPDSSSKRWRMNVFPAFTTQVAWASLATIDSSSLCVPVFLSTHYLTSCCVAFSILQAACLPIEMSPTENLKRSNRWWGLLSCPKPLAVPVVQKSPTESLMSVLLGQHQVSSLIESHWVSESWNLALAAELSTLLHLPETWVSLVRTSGQTEGLCRRRVIHPTAFP